LVLALGAQVLHGQAVLAQWFGLLTVNKVATQKKYILFNSFRVLDPWTQAAKRTLRGKPAFVGS